MRLVLGWWVWGGSWIFASIVGLATSFAQPITLNLPVSDQEREQFRRTAQPLFFPGDVNPNDIENQAAHLDVNGNWPAYVYKKTFPNMTLDASLFNLSNQHKHYQLVTGDLGDSANTKLKFGYSKDNSNRMLEFALLEAAVGKGLNDFDLEKDVPPANLKEVGLPRFHHSRSSVIFDDRSGAVTECRAGYWWSERHNNGKPLREDTYCDSVDEKICRLAKSFNVEGDADGRTRGLLIQSYRLTRKHLPALVNVGGLTQDDYQTDKINPEEKEIVDDKGQMRPITEKSKRDYGKFHSGKRARLIQICTKYRAYFDGLPSKSATPPNGAKARPVNGAKTGKSK